MRCDKRRQIPAVSKILDALGHSDLPRPFVVEFVARRSVFKNGVKFATSNPSGGKPPHSKAGRPHKKFNR